MSEIEKMYKNAKIKKQYCGWLDMGDLDCQMQYVTCNSINEWKEAVFSSRFGESEEPELKYPEFTPEKQLELIEFYIKSVWWLNLACFKSSSLPFDEELAKLTNHLWEDMTISQQEQIRSILNG